jgi:hypothetical protein
MKSFREYLNLIDGIETLTEEHSKFPEEHIGPMTGISRYDGLDNSNPYKMWRFMVAAAGHPDAEYPMSHDGPTGQKMVSLAYTDADKKILDSTAAAMGQPGTPLSDMKSTEPDFVHKVSPVRGFKGYTR